MRSIFSPFIPFLAGSAILSKDDVCGVVLTFIRGMFRGGSRIFLRGGAKGRGVNNHGLGVATKYCA